MHRVEHFLTRKGDLHAHLLTKGGKMFAHGSRVLIAGTQVDQMIMQNIFCMMLWVTSSMLMFSSAHTALTLATTPTVSCPITVMTAFMVKHLVAC